MWRRTTWQSFPHSQPTFLHIIISSWQLTVSCIKLVHSSAANTTNRWSKWQFCSYCVAAFLPYGGQVTSTDQEVFWININYIQILTIILTVHYTIYFSYSIYCISFNIPCVCMQETDDWSFIRCWKISMVTWGGWRVVLKISSFEHHFLVYAVKSYLNCATLPTSTLSITAAW